MTSCLDPYFQMERSDRLTKLARAIFSSPEFQNASATELEFQPKDVWLFDGRIIGHQLVARRRALSLTAKIRRKGLPDHYPRLRDRLYAIHERRRAAPLPAAA